MNKKFNAVLKNSGLTMYELAKQSGISYSLINDIAHGKKNINDRSAQAVNRLAACLGVAEVDIMNPFCIVEGLKGNYCGIIMLDDQTGALLNYHILDLQQAPFLVINNGIPEEKAEMIAVNYAAKTAMLEDFQNGQKISAYHEERKERLKK